VQSQSDILLTDLLELNHELNQNGTSSQLVEHIMQTALKAANADGCFFFDVSPEKFMSLNYFHIQSLTSKMPEIESMRIFESAHLNEIKNKPNKLPAELCAISQSVINLNNVYTDNRIDTQALTEFDAKYNYSTISLLAIPLIDRKGGMLGVAQFINARDHFGKPINFTSDIQNTLVSICQILTLCLENRYLRGSYSQLLESFIEVLARAIDSKSPYTGSHCQKVPIITRLLATAAVEEQSGSLKNFEMSEDDWYALHIASWLHDCGKVTTPEYIVDKATKLETINNRIHEIRNRFEILRRDAHIAYLQKRLNETDNKENLQAQFVAEVKQLEDDFAFIAYCNTGDNPLTETDIERLNQISKKTFTRYFNRMLGLSWAEKNAVSNPEIYNHPAIETLLQDRPDHLIDTYNRGELYSLLVKNGTITSEERQKINEHINVTIDMLKALPFPRELSAIVEYLKWLYDTEKAPDALQIEESADTLDVTIHYCPAVKHLKSRDIIPHESFEGTCRYVYQALAEESGLGFEMISYGHDTGAAKFRFFK
jgi:HD-GYP domain-containing protein (c-di-GMP phosphodiesterase class II)